MFNFLKPVKKSSPMPAPEEIAPSEEALANTPTPEVMAEEAAQSAVDEALAKEQSLSKPADHIVVDGAIVPDPTLHNPGVNTATMQN